MSSTAELYDPPTGTWIPAGTLSQSRALHVAVRLADGRVLVAAAASTARARNSTTPRRTAGRRPGA